MSPDKPVMPHPLIAVIPVVVLIAFLGVVIALFGSDSLNGGSQIALLMGMAVCVCISMAVYRVRWKTFETQIKKTLSSSLVSTDTPDARELKLSVAKPGQDTNDSETAAFAADPIIERMTRQQLEKSIANTTRLMKDAAKRLDFLQAAQYRDEIIRLQKELELK